MRNLLKSEKGITLIYLATAVIVLIIITNVILYSLKDNLQVEQLRNMQNDISNLRDKVTSYYAQYGEIPANRNIEYNITGRDIQTSGIISTAVDTGKFYVIDLKAIENLTLNYGKDYEKYKQIIGNNTEITDDMKNQVNQLTDIYIINGDSNNIFYVQGVDINGEYFYTDYSVEDVDKVPVSLVNIEELTKFIPGKYYNRDTETAVGGSLVTIPAGATISKIPGEYESVEDGVVIYITNGEEITNWNADTNSNSIPDVQENYDQFVWIPVDKESAIIEEGKEIKGSTNEEKYASLKKHISTISSPANEPSKYPMAVKITNEDGSVIYKGILYDFSEENGTVTVTPLDYTTTSSNREPAALTDNNLAPDSDNGITESSLQEEYKKMIERVAEKGGFWVGRYETSNMNSSDFTTNAVNVVRGTTNGINNVIWYQMYEGQKEYKNSEQNTSLKNSATTSSMIWGSQWDQIMIWMRGVKNTINNANGNYYITNSVGMGNYEEGDSDTSTSNPVTTGKKEEYKVKNVYDLAGNVYDWTLETYDTSFRVVRGYNYIDKNDNSTKASNRNGFSSLNSVPNHGSRITLY